MSNVGDIVTYIPTEQEFPMHGGTPQPAIVTSVDSLKNTVTLTCFFAGYDYLIKRERVSAGTKAGTFQQLALASAATAKK